MVVFLGIMDSLRTTRTEMKYVLVQRCGERQHGDTPDRRLIRLGHVNEAQLFVFRGQHLGSCENIHIFCQNLI